MENDQHILDIYKGDSLACADSSHVHAVLCMLYCFSVSNNVTDLHGLMLFCLFSLLRSSRKT